MIARQHPGESMAEFFVEGLLQRLVDPHDALSLHALKVSSLSGLFVACTEKT